MKLHKGRVWNEWKAGVDSAIWNKMEVTRSVRQKKKKMERMSCSDED